MASVIAHIKGEVDDGQVINLQLELPVVVPGLTSYVGEPYDLCTIEEELVELTVKELEKVGSHDLAKLLLLIGAKEQLPQDGMGLKITFLHHDAATPRGFEPRQSYRGLRVTYDTYPTT